MGLRGRGEQWWWAGPLLFEDVLKDGTLVGLELLHGLLELLAALVPLVDAGQQVLLLHPSAHDQVLVAQVVQLLARAVGAVLQVQHQRLEVLLLQATRLHHLLPLLKNHPPVAVLPTHLPDLGLQGCEGRRRRSSSGQEPAGGDDVICERSKKPSKRFFLSTDQRQHLHPTGL